MIQLSNEYDEYASAIVVIDHFKREELVGHTPLFLSRTFFCLPGWYERCKVTGTRINRGIGVGLEIPIEITFVGKETTTKRLKKSIASHKYEKKVLKCKKWTILFENKSFFCNPVLSLSFTTKN